MDRMDRLDGMIFGFIVGAHAKVQTDFLYLESGTIPLKDVITIRRLMY